MKELAFRFGYHYVAMGGITAPYWMWRIELFNRYDYGINIWKF